MTTQQKPPSLPPKSKEEIEAEQALEAACAKTTEAAKKLDTSATTLRRTISDSKMRAVRLPTPSQLEHDAKPPPK
jgi:DNA invertase Pin-like site-specific DNA recombinase